MGLETIIFRTIIVYGVVLVLLRLMGKRKVGLLSVLDFVVTIMVAELAVVTIENHQNAMLPTLLPIMVLCGIQIGFAYITLKRENRRQLIDDKPSTLIEKGKVNKHELKKCRYSVDDLLAQLRQKNIATFADVELAILEPSGELSVTEKDEGHSRITLPLPLVVDGQIQREHLEQLKQNEFWLRQQMRHLGYRDIKKISYCSMKGEHSFFVDAKDDRP
ncbi:DUF421 domain-containing protein [Shouchella shacheensis]|uniref:DUF421 domain-containing protein n=1 Tax=Shouchella shacheensis TaxID=1649580 RepID=UPI0007401F5C|nr:DUF421 domain-containing protein [Shouchella shacheensis]